MKTLVPEAGTPAAEEFLGLGVSYCAVCDGPIFRGKKVAVVGPGEEALRDTTYLAEIAPEIFLVSNNPEFSVPSKLLERLKARRNARILGGYKVPVD